MLFFIYFII